MIPSHALQAARLVLSPNLEVRTLDDGMVLLKESERAQYLSLPPTLYPVLQLFNGERSVSEVLREVLIWPARPSIRAFWDMVVHATDIGVLLDENSVRELPPPIQPCRWPVGWGVRAALGISAVATLFGVVSLFLRTMELHFSSGMALATLVSAMATISLAHLLAGCVLTGCGRRVYRPRLSWRYVLPVFTIDRRDAFMGGRSCEFATAAMMLAVPFAAMGAGLWLGYAGVVIGAAGALMLLSIPLGDSPGHSAIYAVSRRDYQLPRCGHRLLHSHFIQRLCNWRADNLDQYVLTFMAYSVLWAAAWLHLLARVADRHGAELSRALLQSAVPGDALAAGVLLALLLLAVIAPLLYQGWALLSHLYRDLRSRFPVEMRLAAYDHGASRPADQILAETLRLTPIFSTLTDAALLQLAQICTFHTLPNNTLIMREGDQCRNFFMLHDGAAIVYQTNINGEQEAVRELVRGDMFGEMAMLDDCRRAASVRTRQTSGLLIIPPRQLEALISEWNLAEPLPHRLRLVTFLRRVAIFNDWPGEMLMKLAARFKLTPFAAEEALVHQESLHQSFYVVYDGTVQVSRNGTNIVILQEGDFFGEISLLTDQPANASVTGKSAGHCLTLEKEAFRGFITENASTGYVLESIAESRIRETRRL